MATDLHARTPGFDPLQPRLHLLTGKGGVGKSTLVAAMGLAAAHQGRRPLVVELGHRRSLFELLAPEGSPGPSFEVQEIRKGLAYAQLEFKAGLEAYLRRHLRADRIVRAALKNAPLERFFQAAPSVAEVVALDRLAQLESERDAQGALKYDTILVDLDATGHALMLLDLPRVLDGLIGDGPMRSLVDGFSRLLSDPNRTRVSVVSLPGELPVQETRELVGQLEARKQVAIGAVYLNRLPELQLEASLGEALERTSGAPSSPTRAEFEDDRAWAIFCSERARIEKAHRHAAELQDLPCPVVRATEREAGLDEASLLALGLEILKEARS